QRRGPRRAGRGSGPAPRRTRRARSRAHADRLLPGLTARRRRPDAARQPALGDVRAASGRRARSRGAPARDPDRDRGPEAPWAAGGRRDVAGPRGVRAPAGRRAGGTRRAPPAVLQPHLHEHPRPAGAPLLPGRADARGLSARAVVDQHEPRGRRPVVRGPGARRPARRPRPLARPRRARGRPRRSVRRAPQARRIRAGPGRAVNHPVWQRDACELADAVRAGELRAVAVLEAYLERIERLDPQLNAVCFLDADAARRRAAEIDDVVARGDDPGSLAGVPVGVKELASVAGWPETHASVVYADAVATVDDA